VEDEHEGPEARASNITISVHSTKAQESRFQKPEPILEYDYSLMDELFSVLDIAHEQEMQPILCGYFNKIVQALLGKIKQKMLHYLLIHRKGDVFLKLTRFLHHHSLSQLLVELLLIKIVSAKAQGGPQSSFRDRFSSDTDERDNEESEEKKALDPTDGMTEQERQMYDVLCERKQEVITFLLSKLSSKNTDLEETMNAHSVLLELADNEQTYGKLVEKENLTQLIKNACDLDNRVSQAYALNVMIFIIREFPDYEKQIGHLAAEFTQTIGNHFLDITYSCLLTIRNMNSFREEEFYDNQSGVQHRKFGLRRLKALELVRQELQTLSKYVELNSDQYISTILRKQLIGTMLDIIERYPFSSVANQQAILVLDFLKRALDQEELEQLKEFVASKLTSQEGVYLTLESGRPTTQGNLATIVQIALALKKMTESGEEKKEGHEEEDEEDDEEEEKCIKENDWNIFCTNQLRVFETKWTKKLEDYGPDDLNNADENMFKFKQTPKLIPDNESRRYADQADDSQEQLLD
jgi:hypothetical protein